MSTYGASRMLLEAVRMLPRSSLRRTRFASQPSASATVLVRMRTPDESGIPLSRCYSGLASSSSSSSDEISEGNNKNSLYVSPLQDFWNAVEANRSTLFNTPSLAEQLQQEEEPNNKTLKCGIPESALRFTTTSYGRTMNAPFVHPKEHAVILKISTSKLPLNGMEKEILREIVGSRLNDDRHELRLTSDQFGSRIENKRHLVSMLDRIILSCQRLGKEMMQEETSAPTSPQASQHQVTKAEA